MTIGNLKSILDSIVDNGIPLSTDVVICDDGMKPTYYNIDFIAKSKMSVLVNNSYTDKDIVMITTNLMDEIK